MKDVFQIEERECIDQERLKMCEKNHARARKVLWHGVGSFVWANGNRRGEVCGSREKFSGGEGGAERQVRLLWTLIGLAELGQVASALLCKALGWETKKWDFK